MIISKRTRQIQAAEQAVRELLLANEAETPEQAARPLRLAMQRARDYAALTREDAHECHVVINRWMLP